MLSISFVRSWERLVFVLVVSSSLNTRRWCGTDFVWNDRARGSKRNGLAGFVEEKDG